MTELEVGTRVIVVTPRGAFKRDYVATVTRITATLIALDDGNRYNKTSCYSIGINCAQNRRLKLKEATSDAVEVIRITALKDALLEDLACVAFRELDYDKLKAITAIINK